jgi:hypothetical protein
MKKQMIYLTLLSCFSFIACKKDDCTNDSIFLADVKSEIYGEWQLTTYIANIPNPKVPDLKVIFKDVLGNPIDKQIADIYENGKLTNTVLYSLKQSSTNNHQVVQIVSDSTRFQNGDYNFLRGNIRICENQMMIDNGIALDAPGYIFTKIGVGK